MLGEPGLLPRAAAIGQGSRALANLAIRAFLVTAALGLTACGNGGGVTTGSLFGSSQPKPVTDERTERALEVAATSARASRCGYNFNAAKLRQAYLAYETAHGGTPEQVAKVEKVFDYTHTSLAQKIAKEEDFCSEAKTKDIKANLTKNLAGDFSATPKQVVAEVPSGWFSAPLRNEPLDREKIFDPMASRRTGGY
jgi:hypothetical protein